MTDPLSGLAPEARVRDDFGIISRNAEMKARFGNRLCHGKVTAQPWEAPVVVVVAAPKPPPPPQPERNQPLAFGRNRRAVPDHALAEMIRAAGDIYSASCGTARDRMMARQSTMFLIYDRARVNQLDLAIMYGFADHTGARSSICAVRDRLARALSVEDEQARQARIMRLAGWAREGAGA